MPQNHLEWRKSQGYDTAYFLSQAALIGPNTLEAIRLILQGKIHEAQTYNSCKGVLHLGKQYSNERLENAAKRSLNAGKATYTSKGFFNSTLIKLNRKVTHNSLLGSTKTSVAPKTINNSPYL